MRALSLLGILWLGVACGSSAAPNPHAVGGESGSGSGNSAGKTGAGGSPSSSGSSSGGSGAGGKASGGHPSGGRAGAASAGSSSNTAGVTSGGTLGEGGSDWSDSGGESGEGSPCPPKGTPCAIMPLGDSITYGDHGDNTTDAGYRPPLFHLALAAGQSITFVGDAMNGPEQVDGQPFPKQHDGYPGFTIAGGPPNNPGIASFTPDHMQKYKPHIITLMIGTNDIANKYEMATAPDRLGALIDSIVATNPKVFLVVAQLPPSKNDEYNADAAAYNAALPAVVKARADAGKHVLLVDMNSAFLANPNYQAEYLNDVLHPKTAGYEKMADVWYAALSEYLR